MNAKKILVIEDNPIMRKMVRVALHSEGHEILEAPDGETGLKLAAEHLPDLVLLDLKLPDIDGFELAPRLQKAAGKDGLPILAFSGKVRELDAAQREKAGFADFLAKPLEPSLLVQVVRGYLKPWSPSNDRPGQGRRLLLIDDSAPQIKLLRIHLEDLGFEIRTAGDGQEGLEVARWWAPHAIVSDIMMPRVDGFSLCMAMRSSEQLVRIPVVLISQVFKGPEDERIALDVGARAFVSRENGDQPVIDAVLEVLKNDAACPPDATSGPRPTPAPPDVNGLIRTHIDLGRRLALYEAGCSMIGGISEAASGATSEREFLEELLPRCLDASGLSQGALFLADTSGRLELSVHCGYKSQEEGPLRAMHGQPELFLQALRSGRSQQGRTQPDPETGQDFMLVGFNVGATPAGVLLVTSQRWEKGALSTFLESLAAQLGQMLGLQRALAREASLEHRLARVLEQASDGILLISARGEILEANRRVKEQFGRPGEERIGRSLSNLFDRASADLLQARIGALLKNGVAIAEILPIRRPDGSERKVRFSASMVDASDQTVVAFIQDLTDRAQMEDALHKVQEDLRHAQKMEALGMMVGGITHDFNNILTAILGFSQLLAHDLPGSDPRKENVKEILKAGERARLLTRQLLAFSRKQSIQPKEIDLGALFEDTKGMLTRILDRNVLLNLVTQPGLWRVKADPGQIEQVLLNLVLNARDAMPEGGTITVETSNAELDAATALAHGTPPSGSCVRIRVIDTGVGMSEEVKARLFEPFFTTKPPGKGTGLGLSTVFGIVKQSGGTVAVSSRLGSGTTFVVYLPRFEQVSCGCSVPASPSAGTPPVPQAAIDGDVRSEVRSGTGAGPAAGF